MKPWEWSVGCLRACHCHVWAGLALARRLTQSAVLTAQLVEEEMMTMMMSRQHKAQGPGSRSGHGARSPPQLQLQLQGCGGRVPLLAAQIAHMMLNLCCLYCLSVSLVTPWRCVATVCLAATWTQPSQSGPGSFSLFISRLRLAGRRSGT